MTQPDFVPVAGVDQIRPFWKYPLPTPHLTPRPGEQGKEVVARGRHLGSPGPDQGYALHLFELIGDKILLEGGEELEDVKAATMSLATKRATLFGRAPVMADIRSALSFFGYLCDAPQTLKDFRVHALAGIAHSYFDQRDLADFVPEESLKMAAEDITARLQFWEVLLDIQGDTLTGVWKRS